MIIKIALCIFMFITTYLLEELKRFWPSRIMLIIALSYGVFIGISAAKADSAGTRGFYQTDDPIHEVSRRGIPDNWYGIVLGCERDRGYPLIIYCYPVNEHKGIMGEKILITGIPNTECEKIFCEAIPMSGGGGFKNGDLQYNIRSGSGAVGVVAVVIGAAVFFYEIFSSLFGSPDANHVYNDEYVRQSGSDSEPVKTKKRSDPLLDKHWNNKKNAKTENERKASQSLYSKRHHIVYCNNHVESVEDWNLLCHDLGPPPEKLR